MSRTLATLAGALALAGLMSAAPAAAQTTTTPQILHSFAGTSGFQPQAMAQAPDGYLYGTTTYSAAGETGWGLLYRVKPDGSDYQVLRQFNGSTDGGTPAAAPMVGQDGAIYGSNSAGHPSGAAWGTLWRWTPDGQFSVLVTFYMANGGYPATPLVQDAEGWIYGGASGGGAGGRGVIYKLRPDGTQFSMIHQFHEDGRGGIPRGLTLGSDGRLYGVTAIGGSSGEGTAFSVARDGSDFRLLHSFNSSVGEGNNPYASLVERKADGYFYGTTNSGGSLGYGTVFRINAAGDFNTVLNFDDAGSGCFPTAPLLVGRNGNLYGAAPYCGPSRQYGTLFQLLPSGKLAGVVSLDPSAYQANVGLTLGSDGWLYTGLTAGGSSGNGALVKVDPANFPAPVKTLPNLQIYFSQIRPPMTTNNTVVGRPMQLHWVSEFADYCVASGEWSGRLRPEGYRVVRYEQPGEYVYTLTCHNKNGSKTTSQTLYVRPR